MQNQSQYENITKKLYIIAVYGNADEYPDFLSLFARQYNFKNAKEHILDLERHKYSQKMKNFLLDLRMLK